jgi:stress response protein YsnF
VDIGKDNTGQTKEEVVLGLAEESAVVQRRLRETGRVRVSLRTEVEQREVVETLRSEAVEIEHVPIGRTLAEGEAAPQPRQGEDGGWIIPVLEEVLVIERRLVLREELHLHVRRTEQTFREVVPLRHQEAAVERLPGQTDPA